MFKAANFGVCSIQRFWTFKVFWVAGKTDNLGLIGLLNNPIASLFTITL